MKIHFFGIRISHIFQGEGTAQTSLFVDPFFTLHSVGAFASRHPSKKCNCWIRLWLDHTQMHHVIHHVTLHDTFYDLIFIVTFLRLSELSKY